MIWSFLFSGLYNILYKGYTELGCAWPFLICLSLPLVFLLTIVIAEVLDFWSANEMKPIIKPETEQPSQGGGSICDPPSVFISVLNQLRKISFRASLKCRQWKVRNPKISSPSATIVMSHKFDPSLGATHHQLQMCEGDFRVASNCT